MTDWKYCLWLRLWLLLFRKHQTLKFDPPFERTSFKWLTQKRTAFKERTALSCTLNLNVNVSTPMATFKVNKNLISFMPINNCLILPWFHFQWLIHKSRAILGNLTMRFEDIQFIFLLSFIFVLFCLYLVIANCFQYPYNLINWIEDTIEVLVNCISSACMCDDICICTLKRRFRKLFERMIAFDTQFAKCHWIKSHRRCVSSVLETCDFEWNSFVLLILS